MRGTTENGLIRLLASVPFDDLRRDREPKADAACVPGPQASPPAAEAPYRQLTEIAVGGEVGWDYLQVGAAAHRLYVSHATKIVVIDTEKNAVVGEIAPAPGVHGFAVAPDLGRGFATTAATTPPPSST